MTGSPEECAVGLGLGAVHGSVSAFRIPRYGNVAVYGPNVTVKTSANFLEGTGRAPVRGAEPQPEAQP